VNHLGSATAHHGSTEDTEEARKRLLTKENDEDDPSEAKIFRACGGAVGLIDHPTNSISDKTIGAAIEVHRHLGPGLLESSYHACLCRELELRGIPHRSRVRLPLQYKGIEIAKGYVVDLLIEDSLIVEIKSVDTLLQIHSAQLITYMRLLNLPVGLLMNFNVELLPRGIRRILR
jgi:GxxExxY protein